MWSIDNRARNGDTRRKKIHCKVRSGQERTAAGEGGPGLERKMKEMMKVWMAAQARRAVDDLRMIIGQ